MGTLTRCFKRRILQYYQDVFYLPVIQGNGQAPRRCIDNASMKTSAVKLDVTDEGKLNSLKSQETPLLKQLQARIKFSGPLTVRDYMKEVSINPVSGYYAAGTDMFGTKGDFTTSPEISQMFGELVGVWLVNEWYKLGLPKPLQLVELGPGRGTLMHDVLRVLNQFGLKGDDLSIHCVEVSPALSQIQEDKLCGSTQPYTEMCEDGDHYKKSTTTYCGSSIQWYRHLASVPKGFTIFLAHEFFDVLPVHILRRTNDGWRELLVDIDEGDGPHHLRYVLSREETPAVKVFVQPEETREEFEVSPESSVFCNEIANRIEDHGGIALIMDYGHDGTLTDTFRAFKQHRQHDPLSEPGTADLTADVDFAFIKSQVQDRLVTYGPVTQAFFLQNMAIETRLANLLKKCNAEQHKSLISGYKMLTDAKQMGERFKFLAMYPGVIKEFLINHPPAGFYRDFGEK